MKSPDIDTLLDSNQDSPVQTMSLPVLDVLERLSLGNSLEEVLRHTGLNEDNLRACFQIAASRFRENQAAAIPIKAPLDAKTMSLPEALDALAAFAMRPGGASG